MTSAATSALVGRRPFMTPSPFVPVHWRKPAPPMGAVCVLGCSTGR